MALIGERQVTGGMCEWQESFGHTKKAGFSLIIEGFWLSDKFLIRAVIFYWGYVHVALVFPLSHHYRAHRVAMAWGRATAYK